MVAELLQNGLVDAAAVDDVFDSLVRLACVFSRKGSSRSFAHARYGHERQDDAPVVDAEAKSVGDAEARRRELVAAGVHLVGHFQNSVIVLVFFCHVLSHAVDLGHPVLNCLLAAENGRRVEVGCLCSKVHSVELQRVVYLVVGFTQRHHYVCDCVGAREHVLDLAAGIDVPVRHVVLYHELLLLLRHAFALTDLLHDGERVTVFETLLAKVVHYVVTGGDGLAHCGDAVYNQILRVAQPYVRAVGQSGNTDEFLNSRRVYVVEHLADERRSEFMYAV